MKKVIYFVLLSITFILNTSAQEMVTVHKNATSIDDHSVTEVNDLSGIEEIRNHLLKDQRLRKIISEYGSSGRMNIAVKVDINGNISDVRIKDIFSIEHQQELLNSLSKLKTVRPITMNGVKVARKVIIPIRFE